ncbi:MAG: GspE/PulE family protein [Patescibacteria group bacterium]
MDHTVLNSLSVIELVDALLLHAVGVGASDIHCDPCETGISVRMRVDGIVEHIGVLSRVSREAFIARLKILSGARTDIHLIPQDGRWAANLGAPYTVRISFMPTYHGENAVMRLLPVHTVRDISLLKLGFTYSHIQALSTAISKTSGLILVTGPTGSGKTTTLHACLAHKASRDISMITLEDPIEYEIPGIRQVHVRYDQGMNFAQGLRAALRQDPDVIMVGEIRDAETAQVAIHTALTGHLVLSTLHTNSALETIPRLVDMGVDPYLLAATLVAVVGQRLVRTLCSGCNGELCVQCRQTGYMGRSVIAEVCVIDAELKKLIARKASSTEYIEHALVQDFCTMAYDAAEKVEWGITTEQEVRRVLHI